MSTWLRFASIFLAEPADPGLGATVATPPAWVLVAGWVLGIVTLAILWAASRR